MPETIIYPSDPGSEALLAKGSVINIVRSGRRAPRFAVGQDVLGLVGAVVNDQGAPEVAVALGNGVADLLNAYGGFSPYLGDGADAGYNGNLLALAYGIDVPRMVLQPVDLAIKDAGIATPGVDLEVSFTRASAANGEKAVLAGHRICNHASALTGSGTGEADDDVITASGAHGLKIGDTVVFSVLTGGAGLSLSTVYYVVSAPTSTTFTVSATPGGSAVDITTDYTAMTWSSPSYVLATLEDVRWASDETGDKTVRCRQVSGTPCGLAQVDAFLDASPDSNITINTADTTVPDDVDAAELLARYQSAINKLNATIAGRAVTVIAADRTETTIQDAVAQHCYDVLGDGIFRIAAVAPPVGTTAAVAQGSSAAGIGRSTLQRAYCSYAHPGRRRRFSLDSALTAPEYEATVAAHIVWAAVIATTPPEENPAANGNPNLISYAITGAEALATPPVGEDQYNANIVFATFDSDSGGVIPSHRDGVMADGDPINDTRLWNYLAKGISVRCAPHHKRLATLARQKTLLGSVNGWLKGLKDEERIADFGSELAYNASTRHGVLTVEVQEIGTLDILTIKLALGGDAIVPALPGSTVPAL